MPLALQILTLAYGRALHRSRFRNSDHGTRVRSAWRAAADADALVMVLDAYRQVRMPRAASCVCFDSASLSSGERMHMRSYEPVSIEQERCLGAMTFCQQCVLNMG